MGQPERIETNVASSETLTIKTISRVLDAVCRIGDSFVELAERRAAVLRLLVELTAANAGNWSWGHGDGSSNSVVPVALIDFGFSAQQKAAFVQCAMAAEIQREFIDPIKHLKGNSPQIAVLRRDLYDDSNWQNTHVKRLFATAGVEDWVQCVRYSQRDNWSQILLFRSVGKPAFANSDRTLLDIAMSSIPWLHASYEECMPREALLGLTPRQRSVLLLLVDGLPRKQIASHFGITEQTVGDHIKQIYSHFQVNSAGELAARFLRSK